jgi:leucyl-tRNA synthetase
LYREDREIIPVHKKDLPVLLPKNNSMSGFLTSLKSADDWKLTFMSHNWNEGYKRNGHF